jgi:magnesium chelatase family protein
LSGPLLDRIDIRLRVQAATKADKRKSELDSARPNSAELRRRVVEGRRRTAARLAGTPWRLNSQVSGSHLRRLASQNPAAVAILEASLARGTLSMRGYDRCMRIAWSIADLEGAERLTASIVGEAMFLRGSESWAVA